MGEEAIQPGPLAPPANVEVKPSRSRGMVTGGDFLNRIVAAQRRQAGSRTKRDPSAPSSSQIASPRSSSPASPRGSNDVQSKHLSPVRQDPLQNDKMRADHRPRRDKHHEDDYSPHTSNERTRGTQVRRTTAGACSDDDEHEYRRDAPLYNVQEPIAPREVDRNGRLASGEKRLYSINDSAGETGKNLGRQTNQGVIEPSSVPSYSLVDRMPRTRAPQEPLPAGNRPPVGESSARSTSKTQTHDRSSVWSRDIPEASASQSRGQPGRKLFNPSIHDPLAFQKNATPIYPGMASAAESSRIAERNHSRQGLSRKLHDLNLANQEQALYDRHGAASHGKQEIVTTLVSRGIHDREHDAPVERVESSRPSKHELDEDDVAADRARERRKRKEGSEKGSLGVGGVRKRDEERSRGSRSSEGSESLKDRERGRGKGETGIMPRLRDAYKGIQALEQNLTDLHRRIAVDPAGGLRKLVQGGYLGQAASTARAVRPSDSADFLDPDSVFSRRLPTAPRSDSSSVVQSETANLSDEEGWVDLVARHKRLTDAHHDFMIICSDPQIPASLHNLPVKYNIPTRLWQSGFHLLLERMRYTWIANSPVAFSVPLALESPQIAGPAHRDPELSARALDRLTDFIYDAYTFYTNLLEEQTLLNFRAAWIEALGDLSRYRMAIAAHVAAAERTGNANTMRNKQLEAIPDGRIDDESADKAPTGASIGAEVAETWNVEERETWRITARDWYVQGLTERPGEGRLHHHLGLLCRDAKGEETRALYHFSKSLTASHPYITTKESILPLFDMALQRKRFDPDAPASELFLLLHGMLFTKIQLDDFAVVLGRFLERLEEDVHAEEDDPTSHKQIQETDWLLMASINIAAIMQYGAEDGMLRKAFAEEAANRKIQKVPSMDSPSVVIQPRDRPGTDDIGLAETSAKVADEASSALGPTTEMLGTTVSDGSINFATLPQICDLSFKMLHFCLRNPVRHWGYVDVLNPYITSILTFLGTVSRQSNALEVLERYVPWDSLATFFNSIPANVELREELNARLVTGIPLPEDWCIRGMEWVGRRVFERGFWKSRSTFSKLEPLAGNGLSPSHTSHINNEMEAIFAEHQDEQDLHHIDEQTGSLDNFPVGSLNHRRWNRIAWVAAILLKNISGFALESISPKRFHIGDSLAHKLKQWQTENIERVNLHEGQSHLDRVLDIDWDDTDVNGPGVYDDDEDDEATSDPLLLELRDRRRRLRVLLQDPSRPRPLSQRKQKIEVNFAQDGLSPLPGYTVLVPDTNILLSSLELISRVIESGRWTVVVPLPVVTELDGLAKQRSVLGPAAKSAVQYLETNVKTMARSLKIQTAKGNYLNNLTIRSEMIEVATGTNSEGLSLHERTMDDFILRVAAAQSSNFIDRSHILQNDSDLATDAVKNKKAPKVVFLTLDRNLRLRARARGLEAASEKEMAKIFGSS